MPIAGRKDAFSGRRRVGLERQFAAVLASAKRIIHGLIVTRSVSEDR
jgi:hypothetical protein